MLSFLSSMRVYSKGFSFAVNTDLSSTHTRFRHFSPKEPAKKQRRQVDELRRPQAHTPVAVVGNGELQESKCADGQLTAAARLLGDAAELRSASTGGDARRHTSFDK